MANILIVDDSNTMAYMLAKLLEKHAHVTSIAQSGEAAI